MKTAIKLPVKVSELNESAVLVQLSEPVEYREQQFTFRNGKMQYNHAMTSRVVVSQSLPKAGSLNTAIFPCDERGKLLSWLVIGEKLDGHVAPSEALEKLGFQLL